MIRKKISLTDLEHMAREHIFYEIEMFEASIGEINTGSRTPLQRNALLESFLVHARCLFEFLYPAKNIREDDVVADDFFDDNTELRKKLPKSLPVASYLKHRTGKEVAHITLGRLRPKSVGKEWQVGEVHDQIFLALVLFFECLSEDKRKWFPKQVVR